MLLFVHEISFLEDGQCAWLLLLMCARKGQITHSAICSPSEVSQFGESHDNQLRSCFADILAVLVPHGAHAKVVQLPFQDGGLGLRSALRLAPAAY